MDFLFSEEKNHSWLLENEPAPSIDSLLLVALVGCWKMNQHLALTVFF